MSIGILIGILIFIPVLLAVIILCNIDDRRPIYSPHKMFFLLCLLLFLIGSSWLVVYSQQDWAVHEVIELTIQEVNGVQSIAVPLSYVNHNFDNGLINLNKKYGRKFPDGQRVQVFSYSQGPYVGIYSILKHYKIHIPLKRKDI